MGLLDQVIGGVLGSRARQGGGGGMSPIAMALMALLASRAMGQGGLGGMLGGGGGLGGGLGGVLGGLLGGGAAPDQGASQHRGRGADEFAGMLDGPGGAPGPTADSGFSTGGYAGMGGGGGSGEGGLGGLIDSFQRGGLGDVIGSWIGHGPNREVSPHQLEQALGGQTVDDLQRQTGMARGDLLSELARVLPGVVDQLTPHGRPPSRDEMGHW